MLAVCLLASNRQYFGSTRTFVIMALGGMKSDLQPCRREINPT